LLNAAADAKRLSAYTRHAAGSSRTTDAAREVLPPTRAALAEALALDSSRPEVPEIDGNVQFLWDWDRFVVIVNRAGGVARPYDLKFLRWNRNQAKRRSMLR
jgi:hypothetical protein